MASNVRRAFSAPAANTRTRLYTVPAGKVAVVRTVTTSTDNGADNLFCGLTKNGAGWLWDMRHNQNLSNHISLGAVFLAGDSIDVEAATTPTYFTATYVEMDAATEGRHLWAHALLDANAAIRTYNVPAGKRIRIREVVVCPHNGNGHAYVWAQNAAGHRGHLIETPTQANKPLVIATDFHIEAGEVLHAHGPGTGTHLFFSGVIEDL